MKRVKNPLGMLPKAPQKGDKITIVLSITGPAKAIVRRSTGGRKIELKLSASFTAETLSRRGETVRRRDEGITWARGWDTKEADALRVACAL